MKPNFLNRKKELDFLSRKYKNNGFQFIVIYGRRRVGKSELITHFCENKSHVYFLANKRGTANNASRFIELTANVFGDFIPEINNFQDSFKYILKKVKNKKFVVCIDEFSYLIEKDPDITSDFQIIIDRILKNSNIMLILCGSSISMMEKGVLSSKSPLYGRRTGQWKLQPFKIKDLFDYFHPIDLEEFIKVFSIFGDIPLYFLLYDKKKDLFFNVKNNILTKGELLYREGEILLKEELREPETYFDILKATSIIAKPSKIANLAGINAKDLPKYIKNLQAMGIIEKINPITLKKEKTKTTSYFIRDNFLNFWFKFIYPNLSQLEERRVDDISMLVQNNLKELIEKRFEIFCKKLIMEKVVLGTFIFTKIGKQWGKFKGEKGKNTYEIDICALNEDRKEILFGECKWKDKVDVDEVVNNLKKKAGYVKWHNEKRKESYVVFAKSFKKKIKEENVFLFDLEDIMKGLKK